MGISSGLSLLRSSKACPAWSHFHHWTMMPYTGPALLTIKTFLLFIIYFNWWRESVQVGLHVQITPKMLVFRRKSIIGLGRLPVSLTLWYDFTLALELLILPFIQKRTTYSKRTKCRWPKEGYFSLLNKGNLNVKFFLWSMHLPWNICCRLVMFSSLWIATLAIYDQKHYWYHFQSIGIWQ